MDRFVVRRKRKNEESVDNAVKQQMEGDTSPTPGENPGVTAVCVEPANLVDSEIQLAVKNSPVPPTDHAESRKQEINKDRSDNQLTVKSSSVPAAWKNWKQQHPWLQLNANDRATCSICSEACRRQLVLKFDSRAVKSKQSWVEDGFANWKHGLERIKTHVSSSLHINCTEALNSVESVNVVQSLSAAHLQQMMDNRTALLKIFSTLKALARQGLPIRGSQNDENSNFMTFVKTRAEDVAELKSWLQKDGHRWLHHDSQNDILDLMATTVLTSIMEEIREAEFFSISLDETSDISRTEQVSVCLRVVSEGLTAGEYFIGFFSTSDTKAETLFDLVHDILALHKLPISKLRGQCYDGAANVSGRISGLQSRIREEEPRALFVHCNAHNLNLAVQDGIEKVLPARKFIGMIKDLINFVRDSPKRVAQFKDLQTEAAKESESELPSLAAYCPTRWVVRIKSLKTVRANYEQLLQFFEDRGEDPDICSAVAAKASGFGDYMQSFECVFYLNLMIEIFDSVEILNKALQSSSLCVIDSYEKIEAVTDVLDASRDVKFQDIWSMSVKAVQDLDLDKPELPRQRKIPKRFDPDSSQSQTFQSPEDFFRKSYFDVFDQLLASLRSRFEKDSAQFFKMLERFVIGQPANIDEIVKFYVDDFDKEQLLSDQKMFLELVKRQEASVKNLCDVVKFLKQFHWARGLVPEFVRFVRLLVTIPGSSCSNERSFSVLRRLKTYMRSTMSQDRLNSIAILHVYRDLTDKLDLQQLLNIFISKNVKRTAVFALKK